MSQSPEADVGLGLGRQVASHHSSIIMCSCFFSRLHDVLLYRQGGSRGDQLTGIAEKKEVEQLERPNST